MTVTHMPQDEELTQRWVATTIKTVMASRGMRQRDLADAISMTDAHLSQKLNQKNRISLQDVVEIAHALEVDPGELLNGWSGKVPKPNPRAGGANPMGIRGLTNLETVRLTVGCSARLSYAGSVSPIVTDADLAEIEAYANAGRVS